MLGNLNAPDFRLEVEAETARVTQIWELEAQALRREREARAMNRETEGPRAKIKDTRGKKRKECILCPCHCSVKSGIDTLEVSYIVYLMKSSTYAVQVDGAKNGTVIERKLRRGKDGGEIRGSRSAGLGVDTRSTHELAWKVPNQIRAYDIGVRTKQNIWSVERVGGRICWVVKKGAIILKVEGGYQKIGRER